MWSRWKLELNTSLWEIWRFHFHTWRYVSSKPYQERLCLEIQLYLAVSSCLWDHAMNLLFSGDGVVLQSQPAWTIAVVVVFIILGSVCATFLVALLTLMFWRKHRCKLLKGYQLGYILVVEASKNTTWQFNVHYNCHALAGWLHISWYVSIWS